jgi:hypothetical protein
MPEARIDAIRRTPDGLRVEATFACGHCFETLYPRESSARRVSRAQIKRWEFPQGRATRCPGLRGLRAAPPASPATGGAAVNTDVYSFAFDLDLTCSLCARTVATFRARPPRARVLLPRQLRCQVCGGVAVAADAVLLCAPLPVQQWERLKRGRPPRRLQEPAA